MMVKTSTQSMAQLYWKQSAEDFKLAKQALKGGKLTVSTLLSVQSVMNLLSSIWVAKAKFQQPSYHLCELLIYCKTLDSSFVEVESMCQKLDAIQEISLFDGKTTASRLNQAQTQGFIDDAEKILRFCKKTIRKHRWYSPPSLLG